MNYFGFIYITTNIKNQMMYLGRHGSSYIGKDKLRNDSYLGSGIYLINAVDKYGKENFVRVIVRETNTEDNLIELENYYLDLFECAINPNFYNISENPIGGNVTKNMPEHFILEKNRKISKSRIKFEESKTPEWILQKCKSLQNAWKNKSKEEIDRISKNMSTIMRQIRNSLTEEQKEQWNKNSGEGVKQWYATLDDERREELRIQNSKGNKQFWNNLDPDDCDERIATFLSYRFIKETADPKKWQMKYNKIKETKENWSEEKKNEVSKKQSNAKRGSKNPMAKKVIINNIVYNSIVEASRLLNVSYDLLYSRLRKNNYVLEDFKWKEDND